MAERDPEEVKHCPLCERTYENSWRAVEWHMSKCHKDHPEFHTSLKSLPKDVCPYCRQPKSDLVRHKKTCPDKPKEHGSVAAVAKDEFAGLTNDDFLEQLKQRMTNRDKVREVTAAQYMRHVIGFINVEKKKDPQFLAWQWLMVGTKAKPDTRFRALREIDNYSEVLLTGQGAATVVHMEAAYNSILKWQEEKWSSQWDNPGGAIALSKASLIQARKKHRHGVPIVGQGKKTSKAGDSVVEHLDPAVVQQVLDTYLASKLRRDTLQRFRAGDFTSPELKIKDLVDAGSFLTLELYLTNHGVRMDLVQNMTLGPLLNARHALGKCPYCGGLVDYATHKEHCLKRPSKGGVTDYDSGSETSQQVGTLWRVAIPRHKTSNKTGVKEVNIREELLSIVGSFVTAKWGPSPDPGVELFKGFSWERQRTILGRIIKAESTPLWTSAHNPPESALQLNDFRRLEMNKYVGTSDTKEQAVQLRGVGTSKEMLDKVYSDAREESHARSEACRKSGGGLPVLGDKQVEQPLPKL